jgi:hypothetical protein
MGNTTSTPDNAIPPTDVLPAATTETMVSACVVGVGKKLIQDLSSSDSNTRTVNATLDTLSLDLEDDVKCGTITAWEVALLYSIYWRIVSKERRRRSHRVIKSQSWKSFPNWKLLNIHCSYSSSNKIAGTGSAVAALAVMVAAALAVMMAAALAGGADGSNVVVRHLR